MENSTKDEVQGYKEKLVVPLEEGMEAALKRKKEKYTKLAAVLTSRVEDTQPSSASWLQGLH